MKPCQRPGSSYLLRRLLALSLGTVLGVGCATAPQSRTDVSGQIAAPPVMGQINNALATAALQTPVPSTNYRVGAEDLLEITLFNISEWDTKVMPRRAELRVNQEGQISLPLLGDIPVAGLTTLDIEQTLRQRLDEYLYNPQVGVQVKDYRSQQVSVVGAVRNAGVFPLTGPKTLIDLLAIAGGIDERAGSQVHIYRQQGDQRQTYVVDLLALANNPRLVNMPVQPGDVINVPQSGMFFVDGSVGKPGSYPITRPYTLTQALAIAGGVKENLADYSGVIIFRRQDAAEAERMSVNLKDVLAGRTTDPRVEADDVIVVPMSTAKFIIDRFIGKIGLPGFPAPF